MRLDHTAFATLTDSLGRFTLSGVPAGVYVLLIRGRNDREGKQQIEVKAGQVLEVVIDLTAVAHPLEDIVVTAERPRRAVQTIEPVHDGAVYAGIKSEVLVLDSVQANTAQNVTRQVLGRIPSANVSETENQGFPSNGFGLRGLTPTQSVEMNTRQNGVNIAANLYGYPETYYTPPMEAVERIEVVRGAASLQYGPQFGGTVNYVLPPGAVQTPPSVTLRETVGSYGLLNSFAAVHGGLARLTYSGLAQYRSTDGWRRNSDLWQGSGWISLGYQVSDRLQLGVEYSMLRNRIHMPGGETDAEFVNDSRNSYRARNWLASPWNIVAARMTWTLSPASSLRTSLSYLFSQRYLVWKNEDGGAEALDIVDPTTGRFGPREVQKESFHNITAESRLVVTHHIGRVPGTVAAGIRLFRAEMLRLGGGLGTTGVDFDTTTAVGVPFGYNLRFNTASFSLFLQEELRLTDRVTITPGVRFEYVRSSARGYTDTASAFLPRTFSYPLFGVGFEYGRAGAVQLYGNISQAYRPVLYESLTPFASAAHVDKNLQAPRGFNADVGLRGSWGGSFRFDLGAFYLRYGNRIGTVSGTAPDGAPFAAIASVGTSVHRGLEGYAEAALWSILGVPATVGTLGVFTSLAYVHASYVSGEFAGHHVEFAPKTIARVGATYTFARVSTGLQWSRTGSSYGDANNSVTGDGLGAGLIPAYTVIDWSGGASISKALGLKFGINNLTDQRYFTLRTNEYPGPGGESERLPGAQRLALRLRAASHDPTAACDGLSACPRYCSQCLRTLAHRLDTPSNDV